MGSVLFLVLGMWALCAYLFGWRATYWLVMATLIVIHILVAAGATLIIYLVLGSPHWQLQLGVQVLIFVKCHIWENAGLGERMGDYVLEKARQVRGREEKRPLARAATAYVHNPAAPPQCVCCATPLDPTFAFCPACGCSIAARATEQGRAIPRRSE